MCLEGKKNELFIINLHFWLKRSREMNHKKIIKYNYTNTRAANATKDQII